MAAPSEVRAFRHGYLGQFSSQVAGAPAVSWPDWLGRQQA